MNITVLFRRKSTYHIVAARAQSDTDFCYWLHGMVVMDVLISPRWSPFRSALSSSHWTQSDGQPHAESCWYGTLNKWSVVEEQFFWTSLNKSIVLCLSFFVTFILAHPCRHESVCPGGDAAANGSKGNAAPADGNKPQSGKLICDLKGNDWFNF